MSSLTTFHLDCHKLFDGVKLFPIEVDLARTALQYPQNSNFGQVTKRAQYKTGVHIMVILKVHEDVSDGEEAKAEDDENILNLDESAKRADLLNDEARNDKTNLLAGFGSHEDGSKDLLGLDKPGTDSQCVNLLDL